MSFEDRLQRAIQRGYRRSDAKAEEARAKAMSEEERRSLHSKYRLELSEHIEKCMKKLPEYFPGFDTEMIYGERGWGMACSRDDVSRIGGQRTNLYSRLELTIRPMSAVGVLELNGKGTVRNKEIFNRTYFEEIDEADVEKFGELIDAWVLEYAEMYAADT